jgi:hypothetical protein
MVVMALVLAGSGAWSLTSVHAEETAPATLPEPSSSEIAPPDPADLRSKSTDPTQVDSPSPPAQPSADRPPATVIGGHAPSGSYSVRLRELEQRVDELKEQIFRSKARLNLLRETVLHGVIGGARSTILHRNEMGSIYTPVELIYALDGAEIFQRKDDTGKMFDQRELEIYNGSITPGSHTLSVEVIYRGNGYGVFSYLNGYRFTVKSSHTFTATEGKRLQLKVVGLEKGNPVTTDPKDRPAIDFHEAVVNDKEAAVPANGPAAIRK